MNLTQQQKNQFSEILEELGKTLDISEQEFNAAVTSYRAVGDWLCNDDSLLKPYNAKIKPQGSFLIGTTIKPYDHNQDIDIDLVCELSGKNPTWTQKDLKSIVKNQIEKHKKYSSILDKEGRRCWTLRYRENSDQNDKYHMDILPAIISTGYNMVLEKSFSDIQNMAVKDLIISITDKEMLNYETETRHENWLSSNPFGYAKWFINKATIANTKFFSLSESVKPVPKYQSEKLPLQRIVQILKRHRDMMFNGNEHKPISIIITTLASKAYNKETNIIEALINAIDKMPHQIEERYSREHGKNIKWISNPVNDEENFADKWVEYPQREENFYKWMRQVKVDISNATSQTGSHKIMESLSNSLGKVEVTKAFSNIGNRAKTLTEQGNNRFDTKLGVMTGAANTIKPHNFYGTED